MAGEMKVLEDGVEKALLGGDLSKLTEQQRVSYYTHVCQSLGLNPLTQPFAFIMLNGKLTMYARRDCADQLRSVRNVSLVISSREQVGDVYVVTAKASMSNGRTDESVGAVSLKGLSGDSLANALMKAETKAKRRVTLSICGLGLMDETETETVPHVQVIQPAITVEPKAAAGTLPPSGAPSPAAAPSPTQTTTSPNIVVTPIPVAQITQEETKPRRSRGGKNPTVTPERVEEESKRVFGGEQAPRVVPAASGNAGEKAPLPISQTVATNEPASKSQWTMLAIAAKNAGLDDDARRKMCMAHIAERRGASIVPEDWDKFRGSVTVAEAESCIRFFRKGAK